MHPVYFKSHLCRHVTTAMHTCQPTEFKNRETSRNLQGQPAEPCQQQRRASEGCGISAIFRPSVGGGGTSPFYRNFNISLWLNENKNAVISVQSFTKYSVFIADVKSGRLMYQSGRAGDEAKKRKSPAKSGRVGITGNAI